MTDQYVTPAWLDAEETKAKAGKPSGIHAYTKAVLEALPAGTPRNRKARALALSALEAARRARERSGRHARRRLAAAEGAPAALGGEGLAPPPPAGDAATLAVGSDVVFVTATRHRVAAGKATVVEGATATVVVSHVLTCALALRVSDGSPGLWSGVADKLAAGTVALVDVNVAQLVAVKPEARWEEEDETAANLSSPHFSSEPCPSLVQVFNRPASGAQARG